MTCNTHSSDDSDDDDGEDAIEGTPVGCKGERTDGRILGRSDGKSEADCVGDNVRNIEGGDVGNAIITGVGLGVLSSGVGSGAIVTGVAIMGAGVRADSGDKVGTEMGVATGLNDGRRVGDSRVRSVGVSVGESVRCATG